MTNKNNNFDFSVLAQFSGAIVATAAATWAVSTYIHSERIKLLEMQLETEKNKVLELSANLPKYNNLVTESPTIKDNKAKPELNNITNSSAEHTYLIKEIEVKKTIVDEFTGLIISFTGTHGGGSIGEFSLTYPDGQTENIHEGRAGTTQEFSYKGNRYKILITEVDKDVAKYLIKPVTQ